MATPDPRPDTPAARWRVGTAVLAVVMAGMGSFHTVLQGTAWWFAVLLVVVVVVGVAAGLRVVSRVPGLPSLGALAAGALVLAQYFGSSTTLVGVPTADTVALWASLAREGAGSIARQSVPARVDDGILFLLCAGVAVLAIAADAVAVSRRSPAVLGIVLVPLVFAPAVISGGDADLFWIAVAALAFLWLLAAGRANSRRGWDAAAIAATALAAAMVVLMVTPDPSGVGTRGGGTGGSIDAGVSTLVNLGQNLRRNDDRPALSYSTQSGRQHYLRLLSFDRVTGDGWVAGELNRGDREEPPAVPGLTAAVGRQPERTFVTVEQLGGKWLPAPYPSVEVTGLRNTAEWDADSLALRSRARTVRGETYAVDSLVVQPTQEQLRESGSSSPRDLSGVALAGDGWPAAIGDTARRITEGAATNYDRAVALQRYLRSDQFVYSETAPVDEGYDGTGADVIAVFLETGSGYCVHFASAMALMARTLGIPARLAVGFLPGEEVEPGADGLTRWRVTSRELHAWPELYFDSVGWVAFEPTSDRGAAPVFSSAGTPGAAGGAAPATTAPPLNPTASAGPSGRPERGDTGGVAGGEGDRGQAEPPWAVILLSCALLLVVPAVLRVVQRAVRLGRSGRPGAHPWPAWREVVQTAVDLGFDVGPADTPRATARLLRSAIDTPVAEGPAEPGPAVRGLDSLVDTVERSAFSRSVGVAPPPRAVVVDVLRGLRRSSGWGRRMRAAAWPRSLVSRLLRFIS